MSSDGVLLNSKQHSISISRKSSFSIQGSGGVVAKSEKEEEWDKGEGNYNKPKVPL